MSEWRAVPGYIGAYEVSETGAVRSLDRSVTTRTGDKRFRGRVLRPHPDRDGYPQVGLSTAGHGTTHRVHLLVAEAFLGPRPGPNFVVRHIDGNPLNPHASNLRWGTPSDNTLDSVAHGTHNHSRVTHCPEGHAYSPDNTYLYDGRRTCRTCQRAARARYNARTVAA